ncbi:MAG: GNAT superfamily N-acetyltransferase [Verrucomicrobiales bacterium]|jgi:GNAT superfamily N-acetyltransferase
MPQDLANQVRIEPAIIDDLPELVDMLMELFELEADFEPDREKQERGLRLVLEQPSRGRIFVLRNDHSIVGMVNTLSTISTAEGGFVLTLEDFFIHPSHRSQGFGHLMLDYVVNYAKKKDFKRITLLTDKLSEESQKFFQANGFSFSQMIPMRMPVTLDEA